MQLHDYRVLMLLSVLAFETGCAPMETNPPAVSSSSAFVANPLKMASAGHTGCLPDDNVISNLKQNNTIGSGSTWNATCKGKVYLCSAVALIGDTPSVSCAPVAQ